MDLNEFKEALTKGLKINNIKLDLNKEKIVLLYKYMKFILNKNEHINLTAIRDEHEFIYKHYIDSLYLTQYISKGRLIDIGTGAGFPGFPLLIALDKIEVVFLDSKNKKLKIIEEFVFNNELKRASFMHGRAEKIKEDYNFQNQFDYVVTRAVSNIKNIIDYSMPYLNSTGIGLGMRGMLDLEERSLIQKNKKIEKLIEYSIIDKKQNVKYKRNLLILKR